MAKCLAHTCVLIMFVVVCSIGKITVISAQMTRVNPIISNTNSSVKPLITVLIDAINSIPLEKDLGVSVKGGQEARQRSAEISECIHKNTSDTQRGLQAVSTHRKFSTTFFMRPRASFKKLELRMRLGDAFGVSEDFYNEKKIDLWSSDVGALGEWKQVSVEYFKHQVTGFNKHALKVTVGTTNISMVSDYNWLFHDYEGFVIYAEGGAEFVFNCPPELQPGSQSERSAGVWLMVGLLTVATLLLAALLAVWLSLQRKRKRHLRESAPAYPMYDEFDEEVLRNIQKKMDALRGGKSSDVCVVTYEAQATQNPYVTIDTHHKQGNQDDVYYEDPYAFTSTDMKQSKSEEHIYECPYALNEAQKQRTENPYAVIETRKKEKTEPETNIYEDPYALIETQKNNPAPKETRHENPYAKTETQKKKPEPEENCYEDPYALVQCRQGEKNTKGKFTEGKKTEAHYQNIFTTRPHISARR